MGDIFHPSGLEIVDADNTFARFDQPFAKIGTNESRATCDKNVAAPSNGAGSRIEGWKIIHDYPLNRSLCAAALCQSRVTSEKASISKAYTTFLSIALRLRKLFI
ncbi:hypothetical protein [Sedimentimonas flavescens]|uniref:hypothetical protein n=1 Tax=Sedimentimonas flavescens TaxID=2851012 RepID=UPI002E2AFF19|nr:hypothetical protein [Sedimentimonas flavescens]